MSNESHQHGRVADVVGRAARSPQHVAIGCDGAIARFGRGIGPMLRSATFLC